MSVLSPRRSLQFIRNYKYIVVLATLNFIFSGLLIRGFYNRPKVELFPITNKITLDQPVHLAWHPEKANTMFVVQKVGLVSWIERDTENHGIAIDLTDRVLASTPEEGLLSMTFDPEFRVNNFIYLFYSTDNPQRSRVVRMKMRSDFTIDPDTELQIIELDKVHINHNGGMIAFGSDGLLYVSFGDSFVSKRSVADVLLQDKSTLLGTIIRIDVSSATKAEPYIIPEDNPFAGVSGVRGEIWAYGLRNPWRFGFLEDGRTIVVGDVGGNRWEEVNLIKDGGQHFGWPIMEGEGCRYSTDHGECDKTDKVLPVGSFSHNSMVAINGGQIYTGNRLDWLKGKYVFSDYHRGIFAFEIDSSETVNYPTPLTIMPIIQQGPNQGRQMFFSSSAKGPDEELYFTSLNDGVFKLVPISTSAAVKGALYEALRF